MNDLRGFTMAHGEVKPLTIRVGYRDSDAMTIATATSRLFDDEGNALASAVNANINGQLLTATVTAGTTTGERYVEFTYTVGSYTIIERVRFMVV